MIRETVSNRNETYASSAAIAGNEQDHASAQATLGRSLQPVRIVLSIAFVVVVLAIPGESVITLSRQTALALAALAGLNALVSAARLAGVLARDIGRRAMVGQIAATRSSR